MRIIQRSYDLIMTVKYRLFRKSNLSSLIQARNRSKIIVRQDAVVFEVVQ